MIDRASAFDCGEVIMCENRRVAKCVAVIFATSRGDGGRQRAYRRGDIGGASVDSETDKNQESEPFLHD